MPRIAIDLEEDYRESELARHLQTRGYELQPLQAHEPPPPADVALLDWSGRAAEPALAAIDTAQWPADLPVVVLATGQPIACQYLPVVGWLTAPFETLEVVGAVRAALSARATANNRDPALHARLAAAERERDAYELADQKKDEFISYISHELKNPMASIKGYSDLLRRRLAKTPDDPNRKGLEIISAQVGRMTLLLDQLLDFSRISMDSLRLELRPVDLVQIVERLVEECQPMTDRHALQLVADTRPLHVLGDENRLRQALQYVLGNAIKFSPAPGTIMLALRNGSDGMVRVAISDKGIGIPVADQERIFERFARGSNVDEQTPGMGLGLFLAKELINRHNGTIRVESAPNRGSTFTIALPFVE